MTDKANAEKRKNGRKVIIVGAGPGGLTAGMLLAHRGFEVKIYEKNASVGGRNSSITGKGYKFDVGPTFLMMKFILDEVFEEAGEKPNSYLKFSRLDPMYRLQFNDFQFDVSDDAKLMKQRIAAQFPGEEEGYEKFMEREAIRFKRFFPCLQKDYSSIREYFRPVFLRALPHIATTKSMIGMLGNYFKSEKLKLCFTFQSKYLGMSPWECPGQFIIIPYIEHAFGIYHVEGGLSEISVAMAKVVEKKSGIIELNSPVRKIILEGKKAVGVELENGKKDFADDVIINADFAYAMTNLVDQTKLRKWTEKKLKNADYSCSIFMMYLGVNKIYNEPHHLIVFADDYKKDIQQIFKTFELPKDNSFYIRNASISDKSLAPKSKSALYILVPVPNTKAKIDWKKQKHKFRNLIIKSIKKKTNYKDIDKHIEFEKIITPADWEASNVYKGATFNLAHTLGQMLYLRPHNRFEEFDNCYIVGGGTHPGSGLPTIYESGRIAANMISKKYKLKFYTKNLEV